MSDLKEQQQTAPTGSVLDEIAQAAGGSATLHQIVDGEGRVIHSFGTMSFPLRKDHWIYQKDDTPSGFQSNVPPMPFRMAWHAKCVLVIGPQLETNGDAELIKFLNREQLAHAIRAAGKYAVRCATMNGADMDFDPDALLQNLVVGFLGYATMDAAWCDPQKPFDFGPPEEPARFCKCTETEPCDAHANPTSAPPAGDTGAC